jgi:FAD/FMN-containing dehydrogenase
LDVFFQDYEQFGSAHEVLMSFQSSPIAGAEWAIPRGKFQAVFADLQRELTEGRLQLPIVWLKKVEGETAWLSAADEKSVQCGIYHDVIPGVPSPVKEMVTRVERIMLRHGGRPHLSKLIYMKPAEVKGAYPNCNKFDALRKKLDPQGIFWSDAIAAVLGELGR